MLRESYFRPYRVPWLTAQHRLLDKKGEPIGKPTEHSPSLIGESDYGDKDIGFCLEGWASIGEVNKLPGEHVGKDIVLHKARKRDIRQYLKPDSKLVLLFWARQIIAWHYIKYWMQPLKQAVRVHRKLEGGEHEREIPRKVRS